MAPALPPLASAAAPLPVAHSIAVLEEEVQRLFTCSDQQSAYIEVQEKEIDSLRRRLKDANKRLEMKVPGPPVEETPPPLTDDSPGTPRSFGVYRRQSPIGAPASQGACRFSQVPRALSFSVSITPEAVLPGGRHVNHVDMQLAGTAGTAEVKRKLVEAGVTWALFTPKECPDSQGVEEARLLLRGLVLKPGSSLWEQGVRDGSELRLLQSHVSHASPKLRPVAHVSATPRGMLMTGSRCWSPRAAPRFPQDTGRLMHRPPGVQVKIDRAVEHTSP